MSSMTGKIESLRKIFISTLSNEERYLRIIDLGRTLAGYPDKLRVPNLQVQGCQSVLYLSSKFSDGKLFFEAHSDALISAGLAAILVFVYSGQPPEEILKTPPSFLQELGILSSLSPSRSNGLANIHLRMKRDALLALRKSIDFNHASL